jgi:hypothetical protein
MVFGSPHARRYICLGTVRTCSTAGSGEIVRFRSFITHTSRLTFMWRTERRALKAKLTIGLVLEGAARLDPLTLA